MNAARVTSRTIIEMAALLHAHSLALMAYVSIQMFVNARKDSADLRVTSVSSFSMIFIIIACCVCYVVLFMSF